MGSFKSLSCYSEERKIWDWAIMRNNFITTVHIPSIMNVVTDAEPRSSETRPGWKLNESYFHSIPNHFRSNPSVDLFAPRINTQLPRFFSYRADPSAEVINAYRQSAHTIDFYCFHFLVLEK